MSDMTFSVEEMDRHVQSLGALGGQVQQTVSTAQAQPNPLMYGMMMGPLLIGVMTLITSAAGQYLNGATHAIRTNEDQMRDTTKRYRETEEKNVEAAQGIMA